MRIALYLDEGVDTVLLRQVVRSLKESCPSAIIKKANRHFFLSPKWEDEVDLIVIPGGRDVPYHRHLQGEANRRIRAFVERGGRYLGICAGGYFGSGFVAFEEGGELEVLGSRELCFFPGRAVGPAYGKGLFSYDSQCGAKAALIRWKEGLVKIYYNGGCFFENAEKYSHVEVIARFEDLKNQPAAIIACQIGKGQALLSGVHFEYSPSFLQEELLAYEEKRLSLSKSLISS